MVLHPPQGRVTEVADDTSPVLGGNLDASGNDISDIGNLNLVDKTRVAISSGVITVTQVYHSVDGESDTNDILVTINGGTAGDLLIFRPDDDAATITVADTGNIILAGDADFAMSDIADMMTLIYDGTNWIELSRSSNHA